MDIPAPCVPCATPCAILSGVGGRKGKGERVVPKRGKTGKERKGGGRETEGEELRGNMNEMEGRTPIYLYLLRDKHWKHKCVQCSRLQQASTNSHCNKQHTHTAASSQPWSPVHL